MELFFFFLVWSFRWLEFWRFEIFQQKKRTEKIVGIVEYTDKKEKENIIFTPNLRFKSRLVDQKVIE